MITIRKANQSDKKDIFNWRNDKTTRLMSIISDEISWDDHCKWFKSALINDNTLITICESVDKNIKIGTVRFYIEGQRALISINLTPTQRGKNFGANCLMISTGFLKKMYPQVLFVDAEIKEMNLAARRAFERAGFIQTTKVDNLLYYEYILNDKQAHNGMDKSA